MNAILGYLEKQPKLAILGTGLSGVILVGLLEYVTESDTSLFYLIPILYVAWFARTKYAMAACVASTISWCLTNHPEAATFSKLLIHYLNTAIRLFYFTTITFLLVRLQMALEHEKDLSRIDFLTGAANRRSFYETVEREIFRAGRYGHPFTVAYIDVDNFKMVNDLFGHTTGDRVLKSVVESISHGLRASDMVARMGGDEFAVLLFETGYDAAQGAIKKIQRALLQTMSENEYQITFSIGALTCEIPPKNINELIIIADQLMYSVKENGKNAIRFSLYSPHNEEMITPSFR